MGFTSLIGKPAPEFTLTNYDGTEFTFKAIEKERATVLFIYPESGSYGCTQEACSFRDAIAQKDTFKPGKVDIIGLSPDTVEKQKKFVDDNKLTYPVLADPKKEVIGLYGVGKGMMGLVSVARVTFVIDKKGIVRDALDATMNYFSHRKFVEKWLDKFEEEDKTQADVAGASVPTETSTAEPPQPAPVPSSE